MNCKEALIASISPYTADDNVIEKALVDYGVNGTSDYTQDDRELVASGAINILLSFLALTAEREGEFSHNFDKSGLEAKIKQIAKENDLPLPEIKPYNVINKSNIW